MTTRRREARPLQGEDPDLRALHQGRSHRAGDFGVHRHRSCSAARCASSWRVRGISPAWSIRRPGRNISSGPASPPRLARRVDGEGDRDGRAPGGRTGAHGLPRCRSQGPGARSRGRTVASRSRMRQAPSCKSGLGPTGKHAARRPDSVRLAVAECDARVLRASSIAVIGTCLQWRGRASPRQSMASFRALGPLAFSS